MGCFPTNVPINPLRLASNYRDYFGDAHAMLTELTDPILGLACYVPRIIHAPDSASENAGVPAGGFLEYALSITPGAFILGFLHTFTSLASLDGTDAPVRSGFKFQITDVARQFQFFGKPIPEAWLLNDQPGVNPQELTNPSTLRVLNPSPRLLAAPYPVAPPGMFKIDFWNSLNQANTLIRLSLLVAVPNPAIAAVGGNGSANGGKS
jgi:hypothetical protein